jgi:hypothetical protein
VIWSADVGRFTSAMVLRFILRSIESYSGGKPDCLCNPTDEGGQPQGSRNVRERFAIGPGVIGALLLGGRRAGSTLLK